MVSGSRPPTTPPAPKATSPDTPPMTPASANELPEQEPPPFCAQETPCADRPPATPAPTAQATAATPAVPTPAAAQMPTTASAPAIPPANQVLEPVAGLFEVRREVTGQLRSPGPGRIAGHPEQAHPAGAVFDNERRVQTLQRHRAVDVQEIDGQDRLGLTQERAPPFVADSWWRDTAGPEDVADSAGADSVAQAAQFALEAHHTPGAVFRREPDDQGDEIVRQWQTARWPGLGPLPGHHTAVPAKQRAGGDDQLATQRLRQDPSQRREHRPISRADQRFRGYPGAGWPPPAEGPVSPHSWTPTILQIAPTRSEQ